MTSTVHVTDKTSYAYKFVHCWVKDVISKYQWDDHEGKIEH